MPPIPIKTAIAKITIIVSVFAIWLSYPIKIRSSSWEGSGWELEPHPPRLFS
jgi:hypothetical protein